MSKSKFKSIVEICCRSWIDTGFWLADRSRTIQFRQQISTIDLDLDLDIYRWFQALEITFANVDQNYAALENVNFKTIIITAK